MQILKVCRKKIRTEIRHKIKATSNHSINIRACVVLCTTAMPSRKKKLQPLCTVHYEIDTPRIIDRAVTPYAHKLHSQFAFLTEETLSPRRRWFVPSFFILFKIADEALDEMVAYDRDVGQDCVKPVA